MKISLLTLFPEMFSGPFDHSIIKRASEKGVVAISFVNIRDFGIGRHKTVDDTPYGGGIGMVLRVDVLHSAIQHAKKNDNKNAKRKVVLLSADGKRFDQKKAREFALLDHLILVCGHYEGVDERLRAYVDETVSVGDFVVTGGEIPAMLITDAVARLCTGALKDGVTTYESFSHIKDLGNLLEYPQYTRPHIFAKKKVPAILLSGDHAKIAKWREEKARARTKALRPDLLKS